MIDVFVYYLEHILNRRINAAERAVVESMYTEFLNNVVNQLNN